ncbi:tryptophan synthase subunit alpha [Stetteria hydrogenophila]
MALRRPGFSVYLTIGYPSPDSFPGVLGALAGCADFLELGLPTGRPKYDGPTIRLTHKAVVSRGVRGVEALKLVEAAGVEAPFTLMAYMGDFEDSLRGVLEAAASAGALCVLFPDLPFDYPWRVGEYVEESERAGLRPCFFASSRFPHRWLQLYAAKDPLYVYLGLQPATGVKLPIGVERNVRLAKHLLGDTYLLAGFAIRTPEMARGIIESGADGVVVGSAVARALEGGGVEEARRLACTLRDAVHEAPKGVEA